MCWVSTATPTGDKKVSTASKAVESETHTEQVSASSGELQLNIQGASCASCVTKIEAALKGTAGTIITRKE